jgi:N-acetylglucosamine-6-phosphate deacetylase
MASTYPAKVIGANELGKIVPGFRANLTIFSDKFEPVYTIVNGKIMNK